MSQSILNLMLSNLDLEDSQTKSIFDGFDLVNTQCDGNCYEKVKSILQHAANVIQLKDRQIDNLIMALNKSPECKNDDLADGEKTKVDKHISKADVLSKYEDKLNEANALLEESFSMVKSLELQKQQVEKQLASKITENDISIKNYEAKLKELEVKKTGHQEGQDQDINKMDTQVEIIFSKCPARFLEVSNDIAGPGWIIISRYEMDNGQLKPKLEINYVIVREIVNYQRHELYIHRLHKDGSSSFAHFDNFTLHQNHQFGIKSMDFLRSSIPIRGDLRGVGYSKFIEKFTANCVFFQLMVREKQ